MAFNPKNLSALVYANGFTLWHYRADGEPAATVDGKGYFNRGAQMLRAGDIVLVNAADGASIATVARNSGGAVELAGLLAASSKAR